MKKILFALFLLCTSLSLSAQTAGAWYAIQPAGSKKALIIENGSMQNSAPVILWAKTDVPSQLWQLEDNEDGTYSFKTGYLGEYLCTAASANAGTKITARTSGSKKRLGTWTLTPVSGKANTYTITTTNTKGSFMLSIANTDDSTQPTVVDATNPTGNTEWTLTEYTGEVATEYCEAVRDDIINDFLAQYCHTSGSNYVLGSGGWWGDAEMFETILDAFETTGDQAYKTYWTKLRANFVNRNGGNWSGNTYNDDVAWMVLACIRAYKYFGLSSDLKYARDNFDMMWERGIEDSGSLRWNQVNENWYGSNSCINCPAINAACYLYEATGEEDYLTKAKNLWDVEYNILCDHNDGHVWDSGSWDSSWTTFTCGNYWGSTYNQGTMLGACVNLYRLTGIAKYKTYADKVWNWTYNNLCSTETAHPNMMSACQTAVGDLCGFKGILMRYCRLYAEEMNHENVLEWMEKNAWFAYQNANSKGIIWSKWLTKTSEDFKSQEGSETKDFSNDPFGSSTAVSVAFNAHVNRVFNKDAFSRIGAEIMDDMKSVQLSNNYDDEGDETPNTANFKADAYLCFKNVSFGAEGATDCALRLYGSADGASLSLYTDKITDDNKIGTVTLNKGWNDYNISITPTTGTHKVFVVDNNGTIKFHYMTFSNAAGIEEMKSDEPTAKSVSGIYNLAGQRVGNDYKGIVIKNGKKVMQ